MPCSMPAWSNARSRSANCGKSWLKPGDKLPHRWSDVVALQGHRQVGDHEARCAPAIVALALEAVGMEGLLADQLGHRVGQLDLAARAFLLAVECAHHLRLEDVAAGKHQVRWCRAGRGLFDETLDLGQPAVGRAWSDHAIFVRLAFRYLERGDD